MKSKLSMLVFLGLFSALSRCNDDEAIIAEPNPGVAGASNGAVAGAAGASSGVAGSSTAGAVGAAGGMTPSGGQSATAGEAGASTEGGRGGSAPGGAAGHAGTAGKGREPGSGCPTDLPGPTMVEVPGVGQGPSFCIDVTEVTQAQYKKFLDSVGSQQLPQREDCSWNTDYLPPPIDEMEAFDACWLPEYGFMPKKRPLLPVTCIDFCDAVTYCAWAGKRLCGKIDGASLAEGEVDDASKSQWYAACSQGGKSTYSYGNQLDESACNTDASANEGEPSVRAVGTSPKCHGQEAPFDQIFDMVGNAAEWEDNCWWHVTPSGKKFFTCRLRGGSVGSSVQDTLACPGAETTGGGARSPDIGFRCCLD